MTNNRMNSNRNNQLFAVCALLPDGWHNNVLLEWDDSGCLTKVSPDSLPDDAEQTVGIVIPGMPNLHSHAFQRAMS
ncbi:MAG TPA: formimidoylglutamate deiminase, partial [Burkholderiaceae bacterium]|nr:formimidoylglutamate deiminase [Burkholderiaceae bacterium]